MAPAPRLVVADEVLGGGGQAYDGFTALFCRVVFTLLAGWNIERGVPIEEADRLQRKTNCLHRHNGPIFRPDNMFGSEVIPLYVIGIHERTVLLRIAREAIDTGRLVRVVSSCVALCLIVRGDPQVIPGESSALPL